MPTNLPKLKSWKLLLKKALPTQSRAGTTTRGIQQQVEQLGVNNDN